MLSNALELALAVQEQVGFPHIRDDGRIISAAFPTEIHQSSIEHHIIFVAPQMM